MITYTGRELCPPDAICAHEAPSLEDIAVGLGRQSRFGGQTPIFYTVLCHSLVVAQLVPPAYRARAMFHDGHEGVMSDTPTTMKTPAQRALEQYMQGLIDDEQGLPADNIGDTYVKDADLSAMVGEARALGLADLSDKHRAYWHSFPYTDAVKKAETLTTMQVYAGNPFSYLEPENAIQAFKRGLLR